MKKGTVTNQDLMNRLNILVMSLKGGVAKTTNSSIVASYFTNCTLIEIDKINKSDERIDSPYYNSIQMDFNNGTSQGWLDFENKLFEDGVKVIDVGAVKLEIFHEAMKTSGGYNEIDLIIIPAMRGKDDLLVAELFLANLKSAGFDTSKVIFSFNLWNSAEYSIEEQFNKFFRNTKSFKEIYNIDLNDPDNWYALPDKKCIDYAKDKGVTLRSLVEKDDKELRELITQSTGDKKMQLLEERNCVINAKDLYKNHIEMMIQKICKKIA